MKEFTKSFACLSGAHCRSCRAKDDRGKKWRISLKTGFILEEVDFECPYGVPWEFGGSGKNQVPEEIRAPSLVELASNFVGALTKWVTAGAPVVSREIYQERLAVCEKCDLWDPTARMGLGTCKHPKCGCTSLKHWLATEKCPLAKWDK